MVSDVVFHGDPTQGLGFPSGHAAVSAALDAVAVPFLARRWRALGVGAAGHGGIRADLRRRVNYGDPRRRTGDGQQSV
jgi:membrane-associated phospholipid phosphatase